MLRRVAVQLHSRMKNSGVADTPSIDVIVYALSILTNTVSIIGISLLIGLISGEFLRTLLMLVIFGLIRYLSGGYHLKSGVWCIVVSSATMSLLPHIRLDELWVYLLTGIAMITVLLLAPANYDKYARIDVKYFPLLKIISATVVASNFLFMSDVLALAFFTQALLLPFKEGGE
jgi:accessory gene regulator B